MRVYETCELTFSGEEPKKSPALAEITARFQVDGRTKVVKGFYAGNGKYKVRFYPTKEGAYTYQITGAAEGSGSFFCEKPITHGMVKTENCHFVYEDGTLFYPFEKKSDGSWDVLRPNYDYWEHLGKILMEMGTMGIQCDLILFHPYDCWGFSSMTMEENRIYLDYALRRLSAFPFLWWSLANEYDLVFTRTMEEWYALEEFVAENDPYGHLLSNHNCMQFYDFSRPNITHCCVQTSAMHMAKEWQEKYKKPVIFDECCYEGDIEPDWGNISGFEMVNRFWKACALGAYATHGETFYMEWLKLH